ncbi:MAG: flippase-like domain-containing protein [Anaerolineales bacterium]|nr:flippase-like domain-containing protein [Anaerolineales bacterium]MCS7249128.1 flippase-like domain-containing protein [Anaerolineales bacterium]
MISLLCLGVLAYFTDWEQFWLAIQLADYRLIGLAVFLSLVWLAVRGLVWRSLLQEKTSFWLVFRAVNQGYLLNNLLPFRLGEFGRAFLLSRKANIRLFFVLSTIVLERTFDLLMAIVLVLSTLPFVVGVEWARQASLGVALFVVLLLGSLYLIARKPSLLLSLFEFFKKRVPFLERFGHASLEAFTQGLGTLTDWRRFLWVSTLVILNWGVGILQYHLYIQAFFPQAQALWSVFSLGVISLGLAAPSSPASLGVAEMAAVGSLSAFGLNPSTALAFAVTAHLVQVLLTGVIGAFALAQDGESLFDLYRQARRMQKDGQAAGG